MALANRPSQTGDFGLDHEELERTWKERRQRMLTMVLKSLWKRRAPGASLGTQISVEENGRARFPAQTRFVIWRSLPSSDARIAGCAAQLASPMQGLRSRVFQAKTKTSKKGKMKLLLFDHNRSRARGSKADLLLILHRFNSLSPMKTRN